MKISTRTRYGLRIMIFLALQEQDQPISVKVISEHEGITIKYTEQIIRLLKNANLLNVFRGAKGGYALKPDAYKATVHDIFTLLERDRSLLKCLEEKITECSHKKYCSTYKVWNGLENVITNYLSGITIESLANKHEKKLEKLLQTNNVVRTL
ncbi:Rrf2 family transcriptional regulator [Lentisphaerota bacterium WC36G]|nr:Rrf2 family transcriptional regulator [Lentisphaerae bacterium WC36]